MEFDFNKLSDREILILMAQSQKQLSDEMKELKLALMSKAETAKIIELEDDIKKLELDLGETKRMVWIAAGGVTVAVWFVEHFLLK